MARWQPTISASTCRKKASSSATAAIKLKLDDNNVNVSEGILQGQTGRILLTGAASWRNPAGGLTLNFEKFATFTRSDRRLWLSGTTRLGYADGRVTLDGELRADKARIEMPEASRPQSVRRRGGGRAERRVLKPSPGAPSWI